MIDTVQKTKNKGFTILEFSMVLLILSILFLAISQGVTISEDARLKSIVVDFNKYQNAIQSFKLTYDALPGDYKNASTTFGCASCDGDENGLIDNALGVATPLEDLYAWWHLSLAEMIPGEYSGASIGALRYSFDPNNANAPFTGYSNGIFTLKQETDIYDTSGLRIAAGAIGSGSLDTATENFLSNQDARTLELKFDDDSPYTGNIYVIRGDSAATGASGCVNANPSSSPPIAFSTLTENKTCAIIFWINKD